ncbi:MAG: pyruvate kinase [Candidatus Hadarchaeia archaeon]
MKKTKIVCTVGPSSFDEVILRKMFREGMDCVRINTAYGSFDQYRSITRKVRELMDVPVMLDIKGPEVRLRVSEDRTVEEGDFFEISFENGDIAFTHDIGEEIEIGDEIYIDNGRLKTRVVSKKSNSVVVEVLVGGLISDGKGITVPKREFNTPALTKESVRLLALAQELDIDLIALSYTRSPEDIEMIKERLDGGDMGVFAKIESSEGLKNFQDILEVSDGVIVARGDLGLEISLERVPMAQKYIIDECNSKGIPVVTATEMLESMIEKNSPTRAEVSDVANAILDGTDAVMLSGETSIGKHPIDSVAVMSRIAKEVESEVDSEVGGRMSVTMSETMSKAVRRICEDMPVDKIVTLTRSGFTARMISRFRLSEAIIAVTPQEKVRRKLELVFGVNPINLDYQDREDRIYYVVEELVSRNILKREDTVLFAAAFRTDRKHGTNLVEVHEIEDFF